MHRLFNCAFYRFVFASLLGTAWHTNRATKDSLTFSGYPVDASKVYKVTLNFKKDIDAEHVKEAAQGRYHDFTIAKAESGWWPQLLRDGKPHWLKVDFERWKDEDSDAEDGKCAAFAADQTIGPACSRFDPFNLTDSIVFISAPANINRGDPRR